MYDRIAPEMLPALRDESVPSEAGRLDIKDVNATIHLADGQVFTAKAHGWGYTSVGIFAIGYFAYPEQEETNHFMTGFINYVEMHFDE